MSLNLRSNLLMALALWVLFFGLAVIWKLLLPQISPYRFAGVAVGVIAVDFFAQRIARKAFYES